MAHPVLELLAKHRQRDGAVLERAVVEVADIERFAPPRFTRNMPGRSPSAEGGEYCPPGTDPCWYAGNGSTTSSLSGSRNYLSRRFNGAFPLPTHAAAGPQQQRDGEAQHLSHLAVVSRGRGSGSARRFKDPARRSDVPSTTFTYAGFGFCRKRVYS